MVNWDQMKNKSMGYPEKCLLTCILQKSNYITPSGEPVSATITALLPDGIKANFQKCSPPKYVEKCDIGYIFIQCFDKVLNEAYKKDGA